MLRITKMAYEYIEYWEKELAFNGPGHILHSIYWTIIAPAGVGCQPGPHTVNQINNYFGSFDAFKEQFKNASEKVEAPWSLPSSFTSIRLTQIPSSHNLFCSLGFHLSFINP